MKVLQEFKDFLKEYKVIALAVAFIMGGAITTLTKSLVDDIIMPVVTYFLPGGEWQTAVLTIGTIIIRWGNFLSAIINFAIIAFVVFMLAKIVLKEEKVSKK